MSANRFKTIKPKLEEQYRKDLTPKSSKFTQKYSPVYSSFRGGATLKQDPSSKIKIVRPSTSKNSQTEPHNYFHSKDNNSNERRPAPTYNSTKKMEVTRNVPRKTTQYQPRSKSKSPQKQPDQIVREEVYIIPKKYNIGLRQPKVEINNYPQLPKILHSISNFESAKHSLKANGIIKGYSASTNQGPVRDYNEDRVAIILNIAKPEHCSQWRKAAYFGVFDGHGGVDCADFLRDNLHNFITREKSFPNSMTQAISSGFSKCENIFLQKSKNQHNKVDRSGSCAIVTFFYGDKCYIGNVGDSRAIMSSKQGKIVTQLSIDHKACDQYEQKRIVQSGGKIYQTKLQNANPNIKILYQGQQHQFIMGPHRVLPGRLSVTRTFGDIQAKMVEFGGNPNAIISTPQIRSININSDLDFIILASDGIFDKLSNIEIIQIVWQTLERDQNRYRTLHEFCGLAVQNIMKLSFHKKTLDNITVVMIALEGLQNYFTRMMQHKQQNKQTEQAAFLENQRKGKVASKMDVSFERKHLGRSTSPSNYSSLRSKSFYNRN